MTNNIKLITTADGSHSLYRTDLKETYHSIHGALGESQHVFIKEGLQYYSESWKTGRVSVLEVGLGTGLNALLSIQFAEIHKVFIDYVAIEPLPIPEDLYEQLVFGSRESERSLIRFIHSVPWEVRNAWGSYFQLQKNRSTLESFSWNQSFDLIYFDAFAPSRQPEVWERENLKKCFEWLNPNGVLVTYCAQGQFKRNLADVGFEVQVLPGAMGKKEMVRALKK